jgi:hypothetical protein
MSFGGDIQIIALALLAYFSFFLYFLRSLSFPFSFS